MKAAIIIPARMASTRFPGKPLKLLRGKPMIEWVWQAALRVPNVESVVIATPDDEIRTAATDFGARVESTRKDHPSGTDRLAELVGRVEADIFINVQGDEPLIEPSTIQKCLQPLLDDPAVQMTTIACPCRPEDEDNPAVVKVVTNLQGNALYFSRHSIPFARNPRRVVLKRHVGIYGYRPRLLREFASWGESDLEATEGLEQLRFLDRGVPIRVEWTESEPAPGIDTPEQLLDIERLLAPRS
ncbi:MAG: 3-deoxy-manno-octulosonate cytidylyltransferase [Armatimonadetes bacterium]|nr:3-deoxy-manno-octulosonate cytidylyltransferase [Armatimonadota bacterium]